MKIHHNSNENMETPFDPENQFILRLPPKQASRLREAIKVKNSQIKNRLKIALDLDKQHGTVTFDEWEMDATLYNLPTIIESYKTLDRINFYKTADISHLLVCKEKNFEIKENVSPIDNPLYFQWKHGITPPLKNVKKRRFRKTLKKGTSEAQTISRELKYILKSDMMAIKVEYRLIDAEPTLKPSQATEELLFGEALSSSDEERDTNQEDNAILSLDGTKAHPRKDALQSQGNFKTLDTVEEESEIISVEGESMDQSFLDVEGSAAFDSLITPIPGSGYDTYGPIDNNQNDLNDQTYQCDLEDDLDEEHDNSIESL